MVDDDDWCDAAEWRVTNGVMMKFFKSGEARIRKTSPSRSSKSFRCFATR